MYKDEIKELYSQKRESYKLIINDLLGVYFKLKIGYPNLKEEQKNIKCLIKFYLNYDHSETEILKEINNKFGNVDYNLDVEDILDELDVIYNYYFYYINDIINNYELVINNNIVSIIINRINGNYINSNDYKYRLTLPNLKKTLEKEKIIKKIRSI